MKKIVLLMLGLFILAAGASAYQVSIEAPDLLTVGKPLVVTGTTNFGIGTPIDVVLYSQVTTSSEIQRKIVYVQEDKTFRAVFDTTNLKKGMYKVEVPASGLGDSVTTRLVQLVDRSDELFLSSARTQYFNGKLYIAGNLKNGGDSGIQIEVLDTANSVIYGPVYVSTNKAGDFAIDVPVQEAGDYEISFTDSKGYLGSRTVSVLEMRPSISGTPDELVTPIGALASSHARASRDHPAFFMVRPGTGPVTLYTSSSVDWVIEYVDDSGKLHQANDQGALNPEMTEFQGRGTPVYVKVYPFQPGISGDVFLFGENVNSVVVSPSEPAAFAAFDSIPGPSSTQKASVPVIIPIVTILVLLVIWISHPCRQ